MGITGYTVSYDANNATAGIVPVTQTKAEAINLILEENTGNLVKTAYGFCGWNTEPDGSGIKYTSGEEYADDADLTLYAMWYDVGWAGSVDTGINDTEFLAVAADDSGNVWTAGYQTNDGAYTYAGQTASGFYASGKNAVLVKFDSDGNGLWAKTPENETLPFDTVFNSIALDSSGNAYAVGYISGNGVFTFNSGITAAANHAGISSILVKFDPGGNAVWARTVTDGVANSEFLSVTVEGTDVYASGYQTNTGGFNYSGPIVNGAAANENAVLVKFDTDGNTQWAMTTAAGDYATSFDDIVIDSAGYIYAAGYKFDTPASDFGGPIATGTFGGNNALIVKYDPAGAPQWAKSPTTGSNISYFNSITVDNSGNIFAAGYQFGNALYEYTAGGASATGQVAAQNNAVLVKYDSSGTSIWAKVPDSGTTPTEFRGISTDGTDLWISGYQESSDTFTYDTDVTVTGINAGDNAVILKYDADGNGIWGKAATAAGGPGWFYSLTVTSDNVYAAGYQNNTGDFTYGINESSNDVSAVGVNSGLNSVIVKYVK